MSDVVEWMKPVGECVLFVYLTLTHLMLKSFFIHWTYTAPPSGTPTVSTSSTGPTAPDGSTSKPNSPTERDYSSMSISFILYNHSYVFVCLLYIRVFVCALCVCLLLHTYCEFCTLRYTYMYYSTHFATCSKDDCDSTLQFLFTLGVGIIVAIGVSMAVILLVVMITVIAAPCYCYKYKKFCWRELPPREEIEIPGIAH